MGIFVECKDHRLTRPALEWSPVGRRKGGTPRGILNEGVTELYSLWGLSEEDAESREREELEARNP
jgi:hypothetical protein